jgi:hypothetical protein
MTKKKQTGLDLKIANLKREIIDLSLQIEGDLLDKISLEKLRLIKSKLEEVLKIVKDEKNEKDA